MAVVEPRLHLSPRGDVPDKAHLQIMETHDGAPGKPQPTDKQQQQQPKTPGHGGENNDTTAGKDTVKESSYTAASALVTPLRRTVHGRRSLSWCTTSHPMWPETAQSSLVSTKRSWFPPAASMLVKVLHTHHLLLWLLALTPTLWLDTVKIWLS